MIKLFEWNAPFQLVMRIKHKYIEQFGLNTIDFKTWLEKLKDIIPEDVKVFDCLQTNQDHEFLLIRYGISDLPEEMFTDQNSIYRECRSIVINLKLGNIVISSMRKFYNVNERGVEENTIENIEKEMKTAKSIEFTNKLDGSMQSARWYNNKIFMSGSMALNPDNSWRLEDGYSKLTDQHKLMIKENPDLTFIFEYISLRDAHVVLYKKNDEGLYLLKIRNVYTGVQLSYRATKEYADEYHVPMTKIEDRSLEEIMEIAKTCKASEKEGWVIDIDSHMVKIKVQDYIKMHRLLDKLSSTSVIIENIAEDRYDDMMAQVPDSYKDRVTKISKIIFDYKNKTEKLIKEYYENAPKDNKKTFMIWVDQNCEDRIKGYMRCTYLNKEFNVLKNGFSGYKKIKDLGTYKNNAELFEDLEEDN